MGGRARRARAGLWPAVALLADRRRAHHRPDRPRCGIDPQEPGFPPAHHHRLESGRGREDGAAAVPLSVPVLCRRRAALLPALPTLGGRVPRRAVQHRLLRVAYADGSAGDRFEARRVHPHAGRRASLSQSSRAGPPAAFARAAYVAEDAHQPGRQGSVRVPLRGFQPRRLRSASAHQGQGGGVTDGSRRDGTVDPQSSPAIVLVAAVGENGVIGRDGGLPWRLKSDMKHFRALTWGKPVIMGRKTHLTLRRPLTGRTNIVITRDATFSAPGVLITTSLENALAVARGDALRRGVAEIAVAGGAEIYKQTL